MISDKELDNVIYRYNERKYLAQVTLTKGAVEEILELLQELKQRRECELRPATKFTDQATYLLIYKIDEEVREIKEAYEEARVSRRAAHFAEELVDLQMVCETILASINLNADQRMAIRKSVIDKNKARGYYDEK